MTVPTLDRPLFDHMSLGVADLERAVRFYDAALGVLGWVRLFRSGRAAGYGPEGFKGEAPFAIVAHGDGARSPGPGFHLAFMAADRDAVGAFFDAALAHGGIDDGPPGIRENYDPGYYAAFVVDPDGHRLEAVVHEEVDAGSAHEDAWSDEAAEWDDNPVVIAYANAAWASLQRAFTLDGRHRVLDFGAGTGLLAERLAEHVLEVVSVDASPSMIEVLAAKGISNVRHGVARWEPGTIDRDPLSVGPFDLVVCSSVCAFLDDYPGAVAMLASRLGPGGLFVQWDWELDPEADEPFGLSRDTIAAALANAGLELLSLDTGFDIVVEEARMRPLMAVGRKRQPA